MHPHGALIKGRPYRADGAVPTTSATTWLRPRAVDLPNVGRHHDEKHCHALGEGVASARISRYETAAHEPPASMANRLAEVLGVLPPYFHCEDDELAAVILAWRGFSGAEKTRAKDLVLALAAAS